MAASLVGWWRCSAGRGEGRKKPRVTPLGPGLPIGEIVPPMSHYTFLLQASLVDRLDRATALSPVAVCKLNGNVGKRESIKRRSVDSL